MTILSNGSSGRRRMGVVSTVLIASLVGVPRSAGAQHRRLIQRDTDLPQALFVAVLQTVRDSSRGVAITLFGDASTRLAVDPRPLRTRPLSVDSSRNAFLLGGNPELDSLSASISTARLQSLRDDGVDPGDITSLNNCRGGGPSPDPNTAALPNTGCPQTNTFIVAFGLLDRRGKRATVQVLALAAPPRMAAITPYVFEFNSGKWRLLRKEVTAIIE